MFVFISFSLMIFKPFLNQENILTSKNIIEYLFLFDEVFMGQGYFIRNINDAVIVDFEIKML